jgi:hypothetical protein
MFDPEWDDNLYAVYAYDKTRGVASNGAVITIEQYDGTGPDDPRCRIARGGDCCLRTRGHLMPHVACSNELAAMGMHIIARTVPQ